MRGEFKILIGEKTAEAVKMAIGSVVEGGQHMEAVIRGRDLITGLAARGHYYRPGYPRSHLAVHRHAD